MKFKETTLVLELQTFEDTAITVWGVPGRCTKDRCRRSKGFVEQEEVTMIGSCKAMEELETKANDFKGMQAKFVIKNTNDE